MSLLQEALDACDALARRLKRGNKVKVLKLRRLKKVGTSQRIKSSDDTDMEDASNQGRMIDELDRDKDVALMDDKGAEKKAKEAQVAGDDQVKGRQAEIYQIDMDHASKVLSIHEDEPEVQEVVDVVTTAKLITEVVTAASESVIAASTTIVAAEPQVHAVAITAASVRVAAASTKRRKRVVIKDPEKESTAIILADTKSKDKGKGIMVEKPKPMKKKQQVKMDEEYARKLHEELNKDIDWDVAIDHVKQKAKEDPYVQRYQIGLLQGMSYNDIHPIFEAKFNSNIEFLLKSKEQIEEEENRAIQSINETPTQKAAKRGKLNKEFEDLKEHLEIVPDEDDDVYTEATPLARKVPVFELMEHTSPHTTPKVLYVKQWKPTDRLIPLGGQYPLARPTALTSDTILANPHVHNTPVEYNLVCANQQDPNCCSKHMIRDHSQLRNFVKKFIGTVRFGNDHFGAIMGYGNYVLSDSVIFRVYHVEGLGHNLFSVGLMAYYESIGITHEKTVPRTPQKNGVVERRNCTLVEAAQTMMIFSKALMFLWAEAVATACYTQNRSLIHTLHNKTPYELVHDKKPDLSFLYVFGALCYPTNDSEDLGKLKAKADIGLFVGYAPNMKGYRIYNKRTRQIMETIHVTFDELTRQTVHVQTNPRPAPNLLMHRPISSGLVPNHAPVIPYVPPTKKELEILFQPMFDEYFKLSTIDQQVPPAPAVYILVNPPCPSVSSFVDQDALSEGHSPSSSDHQSSSVHHGVAAGHSLEVNPFTPADNEPSVDIFQALKYHHPGKFR
nr:retrovirus-related Pol polyprotein from transposon TNT 1-94 [Tanacetum cinerariifolium]